MIGQKIGSLPESNPTCYYETSPKMKPLLFTFKNLPTFYSRRSPSGSMWSLQWHSELKPSSGLNYKMWAQLCSWRRQPCRVVVVFSSRDLVLEDHAEQLASQAVGQPRVLDDGHLQALAAEHSVVVGVNSSAHTLNYNQVSLTFPNHHRQHFVETAGE